MQNSPALLLVMIAVSLYVIWLWWSDYQADKAAKANPRGFPGATAAPARALVIALIGAWIILAVETWGEIGLGVSQEQSNMTALFALYTLCAAFVEEVVFRGFIVIDNKGAGIRWLSIFAASLLFAALHPFLWEWKDNSLVFHFGSKGIFSTAIVFISSLWFYTVRFAPFNPRRSLAPCFAAHFGKNFGVIVIKAAQGHFAGLF
ncbi:MAG TPA: CPBP family glutamic-type intramembrane protease [Opitutaceae bacterium]